MILDITEQEYRNLDIVSYSTLSSLSRESYKALRNTFNPTHATRFGILTESLLFGDYDPEDYYVFPDNVVPADKLKEACDIIFPMIVVDSKKNKLEEYSDIIEILLSQYDVDYYKNRTVESRTSAIIKEGSEYWKHVSKSYGKISITEDFYRLAQTAANTLKTHEFTSSIFSENSFINVEKKSQVKLKFKYKGIEFKSMLDWLVIDHHNKVIHPYDLKTGGKPVEEFEKSFFYWRYDIQATLYLIGILKMRDELYPGYKVNTFKFVYISREDVYRPIVWKVKQRQYTASIKGFVRNKIVYKGLLDLVKDYDYYLKNQNLQYPKEVYDCFGELYINDDFEIND